MSSNALYFPYIALPNDIWTTRSLLYWDKISSVLPRDHLYHPEQTSDFMRDLLSEGLVESIMPSQHIDRIPRFDGAFIELVEFQLQRRHQDLVKSFEAGETIRIHAEKLSEIPRSLVELGLAKRVDWAWYDVEMRIAHQFMAYLASCLGQIPELDATPITNPGPFTYAVQPFSKLPAQILHHNKSRAVVLENLLPIPMGTVPIDKLIRFKLQHGHLLPSLRASIEAHCTYVSTLPKADQRVEANKAFLLESKHRIAEIEETMRPTFGKVVLGSIAPMFSAALAVRATGSNDMTSYAAAISSLAGASYSAVASIRGGHAVRNRPLAYAFYARRIFAA